MQRREKKGSTTDHVLGKTASKKVIEAGGFEQFSEDLYDVLSTQAYDS